MRDRIIDIINEAIHIKEEILHNNTDNIIKTVKLITHCFRSKGKLLLFGNGGSAADAQHIAAEFIGRFQKTRPALPAIALNTNTSILTALGNDFGYDVTFVRQIEALGLPSDTAIGISTSGKAKNVILAVKKAKEMGLKTISFTGGTGGELIKISDICMLIPSNNTARIQEAHITIGHIICELVETELLKD